MKKIMLFFVLVSMGLTINLSGQTVYVDAVKGNDNGSGAVTEPVASLEKAVVLAKSFTGNEAVTIKIAPGLYLLNRQIKIEAIAAADTAKYTLEATTMPDDKDWLPASMPVIQSVSSNNIKTYFTHCAGIEILRSNVSIQGLKFTGNANPGVRWYYPIERDSPKLTNLDISQCMFIGEKNSAPVQGAVYTEGAADVHIDHCIFYGCKNAALLFFSTRGFSLTHSIIWGAYEAGVWYGFKKEPDAPFIFSNNIVSHCHYFWASAKGEDHPSYVFSNSLITGNDNYMAVHNDGGLTTFKGGGTHKEINIRKTGMVLLNEITADNVPKDYLEVATGSDGKDIDAGLFKR